MRRVTGNGDADKNAGDQSQSGTSLVTGSSGLGSLHVRRRLGQQQRRAASTAPPARPATKVNAAAPSSASIQNAQNATPPNPGTSAVVQSGATINAGQNINVGANQQATIKEVLGQVAAGVVGVGASVDVLTVNENVQASDDGTNTAGNNIYVWRSLNDNINVLSLGPAGGLRRPGRRLWWWSTRTAPPRRRWVRSSTAKNVSVEADSTRTVTTLAGQANIGAVGAGVTFTTVNIGGSTTATVDANATLGSRGSTISSLAVTEHSTVNASVETDAVAAGIGAFGANFSFLTVNPTDDASIGNSTSIDATGAVNINATDTTSAVAKTLGVAAGGLCGRRLADHGDGVADRRCLDRIGPHHRRVADDHRGDLPAGQRL